jgi:hypothetical protein
MSLDSLIDKEYVPWRPGFIGMGKSRIVVPKGYEEKGLLKRAGKYVAPLILAASLAACNGEQITPPPPVCEINPAVELAQEYGLPDSIVEAVRPLGDDCVVDKHEHNLITTLLPGILSRSNETITLSYPERFIGDDGSFDSAENIVMSRFFLGRYDREGLLVHPGYFELVDNGHVQIPNAYFIPIFEMPFRFDPFPAADSGGKGLPIVEDKPYLSGPLFFDRSLEDRGVSWFELYSELITPELVGCSTDGNNVSMQLIFNNLNHSYEIDKLELVNPLPVPVRITDIGFYMSIENIRNARISVVPEYWPPSLGHLNLIVSLSHVDDVDLESSGLEVGSIIPVEGRLGQVDPDFFPYSWRLLLSFRSDNGYVWDRHKDLDSRFRVIDVFDPHPFNPERRGLVWPVYYQEVKQDGMPLILNLGVHTGNCLFQIDGTEYFGNHPSVPPMKYNFPNKTIDRYVESFNN